LIRAVLAVASAPRRLSSPLAAVVAKVLNIQLPPLQKSSTKRARKQREFPHKVVRNHSLYTISAELASGIAEQVLENHIAKLLLPAKDSDSPLTSVELLSALYGRPPFAAIDSGAALLRTMTCSSKNAIRALLGFSGGDTLVKNRAAPTTSACAPPDPSELQHSWKVLQIAKRGASLEMYVDSPLLFVFHSFINLLLVRDYSLISAFIYIYLLFTPNIPLFVLYLILLFMFNHS